MSNDPWDDGEPAYFRRWQEVLIRFGKNPSYYDTAFVAELNALRTNFAWAIPTSAVLNRICDVGPLIELGAGNGYWARLLRDLGADVVAYDLALPESPWTRVEKGDAGVLAQHRDRTLFFSWPPRPTGDDDWIHQWHGPQLALITDGSSSGMGRDGDPLYRELDRRWALRETVPVPHWPLELDDLTIWDRR